LLKEFAHLLPPEGVKILLVLFLSFLIGLEREERKGESGHYLFGGVRTFPLIGLLGYAMALISGDQLLPLAFGFAVVGSFLLVSYIHKLHTQQDAGVTTEITGLGTFVIGILVYREYFWIASTLVVISMLLLELKTGLETLARRLPAEEIATFTKFLLITAVILPVVPNKAFTDFNLNPFKTWLIVVAVSTISYGSYLLQKRAKGRGGIVLSAILGGAYSSTVTTVVLAKKSREQNHPYLFAGSILMASGVMYIRLVILIGIFNGQLGRLLAVPFLLLFLAGTAAGWLLTRRKDGGGDGREGTKTYKNPLELRAAFLFAAIFLAVLIVTDLTIKYIGEGGLFTLAAVMGVTDVDPFILSLTQTAGSVTPLLAAATSIIIASASNNVAKGIYAYSFADRKTAVLGLIALLALAAVGLMPLLLL
jgi:uncharacterized membrane protein (DUF4010 family)